MGLFSFLRKNKQEAPSGNSEFYSRAEEESNAVRRRRGKKSAEPVDPVLPEKKRARRRLVGALALVLAAVIGLPMILDSEPKPLADDVAIQIPSKDKPIPSAAQPAAVLVSRVAASASLDQKEEMMEAPPAITTVGAVVAAGAIATSAKGEKAKDDLKPSDVVKPAAPEKAPLAAPTTKTDSKVEVKQEPAHKPESKAAAHIAEKPDEAARAKAILEGKAGTNADAAKAASDKKSEKFVIQVAALASKEKINELQGKLKKAGIQSYTQKVATESGERTRIRIGPFATKEEAEKMRAKLAKLGLNGTLVPPSH